MKEKLKRIYKESKLLFIMTTITFIIFIIFFIFPIKIHELSYKYIILIMGIIPFLVFLLTTILSSIFTNKKYLKIITGIITYILTFALPVYYIIVIFFSLFIDIEHPVKNIKYYNEYVSGDYLLNVFPKEIPKNVKDIQLIYSPGLLQGGTTISLYYVDNKLNVEYFNDKYTKKSKWIGIKEEYSKQNLNWFSNGTPIKYKEENNFKIYLVDDECDDSGYCNHGQYLLVGINENTNEVLYQYKQW